MDKLLQEHNYNLLASDMISLHRSLPDARSAECRRLSYPSKLPTTSVIIIFHNEGWSTLLRTIWSVIDRSPRELVNEIILVDDCSTWEHLNRPLEDYVELLPVKVKIIRAPKRVGLIRARLYGAKYATVSIITISSAIVACQSVSLKNRGHSIQKQNKNSLKLRRESIREFLYLRHREKFSHLSMLMSNVMKDGCSHCYRALLMIVLLLLCR